MSQKPDTMAAERRALARSQKVLPLIPPHILRELVNDLRDTAIKYHGAEQLRERIRDVLCKALDAPAVSLDPAAWGIFDSQGFYESALDDETAKRFCAHYNRRHVDPLKPYRYGPLYGEPTSMP